MPSRTAVAVRYEHEIFESLELVLSLETDVLNASPSEKVSVPINPDDPVLATRGLYETEPLTRQVSGMLCRLKYGGDSDTPFQRRVHDSGGVGGWAATAGATVALPVIGEDDQASAQVSDAVNASPYLFAEFDF